MGTVGFIFMGLALVLLGVIVPICDSRIRKANGELAAMVLDRDTRLTVNFPQYLVHTSKEKILRLTKMFLDQFDKPQAAKEVQKESMKEMGEAIAKLYLTTTGQLPPEFKIVEWQGMTPSQWNAEQKNILKIETTTKLLGNITDKKAVVSAWERRKTTVIISTTVVQVIVLILLQIASKN